MAAIPEISVISFKDKKIKKNLIREKCQNHPDKSAVRYCDRCELSFCNDCIKEYWSHNFLSYAYLGESKDFNKEYLCFDCEKSIRRKGLTLSIVILAILSLAILSFITFR